MNKSKLQKEALAHYDRMIEWAKKQKKFNHPNDKVMLRRLGENWMGLFCVYCTTFSEPDCVHNCVHNIYGKCPLNSNSTNIGRTPFDCCNQLWLQMSESETWEEWIINAELVKKYIKENG